MLNHNIFTYVSVTVLTLNHEGSEWVINAAVVQKQPATNNAKKLLMVQFINAAISWNDQ